MTNGNTTHNDAIGTRKSKKLGKLEKLCNLLLPACNAPPTLQRMIFHLDDSVHKLRHFIPLTTWSLVFKTPNPEYRHLHPSDVLARKPSSRPKLHLHVRVSVLGLENATPVAPESLDLEPHAGLQGSAWICIDTSGEEEKEKGLEAEANGAKLDEHECKNKIDGSCWGSLNDGERRGGRVLRCKN